MSDKDQIKELFSQKLSGYEAKVNPELWSNIASQVGTTTAAASGAAGTSLLTKIIVGVSAASVITTGIIMYSNSDSGADKQKSTTTESVKESNATDSNVETVSANNNNPEQLAAIDHSVPEKANATSASPPDDWKPNSGPVAGNEGRLDGVIYTPNPGLIEGVFKKKEDQDKTDVEQQTNPENTSKAGDGTVVDTAEEKLREEDAVKPGDTPEKKEEVEEFELVLVNVFSPNRDNVNDYLKLDLPDNVSSFQITVLNAKNEVVYSSDNPNFRWYGDDFKTGQPLNTGTYVYFVIVTTEDGKSYKKSQTLKITR